MHSLPYSRFLTWTVSKPYNTFPLSNSSRKGNVIWALCGFIQTRLRCNASEWRVWCQRWCRSECSRSGIVWDNDQRVLIVFGQISKEIGERTAHDVVCKCCCGVFCENWELTNFLCEDKKLVVGFSFLRYWILSWNLGINRMSILCVKRLGIFYLKVLWRQWPIKRLSFHRQSPQTFSRAKPQVCR